MSGKPEKHERMSDSDQLKLAKAAKKGNKKAIQKLFAYCDKEIGYIVSTLRPKPTPIIYDDLIQEGRLALYRALKKYDPKSGVRFSYFAMYWIRALATRYIQKQQSIVRQGDNWPKPDISLDAPLCDQFCISTDEERDAETYNSRLFDINQDPTPEEAVERAVTRAAVQTALSKVVAAAGRRHKTVARDIIWNRLIAEKVETLEAIGQRHGMGRENARKIESRVLDYFKKNYLP